MGALEVPVWQESLSLHHPQLLRTVHVAQLPLELHESAEFAQRERVPDHLAQVRPMAGPVGVPDMQVLSLAHHPHPERPVQAPQSVSVAQGSAPTLQVATSPAHMPPQVPMAGPLRAAFAVTQRLVAPHQPQPERARQPPHPESESQVSVGLRQVTDEKVQPVTQRPSVGPETSPGTQMLVPPHHPQPPKAVHPPQEVARAQGLTVP